MTTALFARNGSSLYLAADSRQTIEPYSFVNAYKIVKHQHGFYTFCGHAPEWRDEFKKIDNPYTLLGSLTRSVVAPVHIILTWDKGVYMGVQKNKNKGQATFITDDIKFFGIGSGGDLAMGYLAGSNGPLKKRVEKAVAFAIRYDKYSGYPIRIQKI